MRRGQGHGPVLEAGPCPGPLSSGWAWELYMPSLPSSSGQLWSLYLQLTWPSSSKPPLPCLPVTWFRSCPGALHTLWLFPHCDFKQPPRSRSRHYVLLEHSTRFPT
jgi:hypothetical protein